MAKDKFHDVVRDALIKDGWEITHDPYMLIIPEFNPLQVDLGAEKVLGAEKEKRRIAVEVKSFISPSFLYDFYGALGQFIAYRTALAREDPERVLYLAVPSGVYNSFFDRSLTQTIVKTERLNLIVYHIERKEIVSWQS